MSRNGRKSLFGVLALFALTLLVAAGCGGSSDSSESTSQSGDTSSEEKSSSSDFLKKMEAEVETAISAEGSFSETPTTSPVRAGESKTIAVISCGQEIGACAIEAEAAQKAADKLGWQTKLFDGKFDAGTQITAIRQALAEKVDGIHTYYIDCQFIQSALVDAKEAGVPVVNAQGRDCDETDAGTEPLFAWSLLYNNGLNLQEQLQQYGRVGGAYAIVENEGKSDAIAFYEDTPSIKPQEDGLKEAYAECPECSLDVITFPGSAYGTKLQGIGEQNILKNPDVDTVLPSFEAAALEIFPGVRSSGREEEILSYLGEGNTGGLDLLREGANAYAVAWPVAWEGWSSMDTLGRIFLGDEPVATGMGFQLVTTEDNLSKSGEAKSPIDYEAMYEKAWQLK